MRSANWGGSQLCISAVGVPSTVRSRSTETRGESAATPRASAATGLTSSVLNESTSVRGLLAAAHHVVVEAGELVATVDHLARDRRADPATTHEQPAVHQLRDGAAHRGAREVEALGEGQLVLERVARLEPAVLDRRGELLGQLVVERHRAAAVDGHGDDVHGAECMAQQVCECEMSNVLTNVDSTPGAWCSLAASSRGCHPATTEPRRSRARAADALLRRAGHRPRGGRPLPDADREVARGRHHLRQVPRRQRRQRRRRRGPARPQPAR